MGNGALCRTKNRHKYLLQTKSNMNELQSLLYADMGTQNNCAETNIASMRQLGTIHVLPCPVGLKTE